MQLPGDMAQWVPAFHVHTFFKHAKNKATIVFTIPSQNHYKMVHMIKRHHAGEQQYTLTISPVIPLGIPIITTLSWQCCLQDYYWSHCKAIVYYHVK